MIALHFRDSLENLIRQPGAAASGIAATPRQNPLSAPGCLTDGRRLLMDFCTSIITCMFIIIEKVVLSTIIW